MVVPIELMTCAARASCYRTGSGSDRVQALNAVVKVFEHAKGWIAMLSVASGRYRSRFFNPAVPVMDCLIPVANLVLVRLHSSNQVKCP